MKVAVINGEVMIVAIINHSL